MVTMPDRGLRGLETGWDDEVGVCPVKFDTEDWTLQELASSIAEWAGQMWALSLHSLDSSRVLPADWLLGAMFQSYLDASRGTNFLEAEQRMAADVYWMFRRTGVPKYVSSSMPGLGLGSLSACLSVSLHA